MDESPKTQTKRTEIEKKSKKRSKGSKDTNQYVYIDVLDIRKIT